MNDEGGSHRHAGMHEAAIDRRHHQPILAAGHVGNERVLEGQDVVDVLPPGLEAPDQDAEQRQAGGRGRRGEDRRPLPLDDEEKRQKEAELRLDGQDADEDAGGHRASR